jgi:nucleoside-diphosphate-sugar epimerase
LSRLIEENRPVIAFMRDGGAEKLKEIGVTVASLADPMSWPHALQQCSIFVHCAGQAHITKETGRNTLQELRAVNTDLTLALARSAATAGVKRFVFVSSIGVNGLTNHRGPFTPAGDVNPTTPYAKSKYEAEQGLLALSNETGLEIVVIRPPLVYGADAPGNFGAIVAMLERGWPLPLGAVTTNQRSYVALPNLVDLLITVCDHPAAKNQTFLVSDDEDLSTADFLCRLALAMGRPANLWRVPIALLKLALKMLGRHNLALGLLADLRVDITKTRQLLDWSPTVTMEEGLNSVVRGFPHLKTNYKVYKR